MSSPSSVPQRSLSRWIFYISIFSVLIVSLAYGFYQVGAPNTGRLRRFDESNSSHLTAIAQAVDAYYQQQEKLPLQLDDLVGRFADQTVLTDLESKTVYTYHIQNEAVFSLCATFHFESSLDPLDHGYYPYPQFWTHPAGQQCFIVKTTALKKNSYPAPNLPVYFYPPSPPLRDPDMAPMPFIR